MCFEAAPISAVLLLAAGDGVPAPLGCRFGGLVEKTNQRVELIDLTALIMS